MAMARVCVLTRAPGAHAGARVRAGVHWVEAVCQRHPVGTAVARL